MSIAKLATHTSALHAGTKFLRQQQPPSSTSTPSKRHLSPLATNLRQQAAGWAAGLGLAATLILAVPSPAHADEASPQLFANTCAGCHAGGGNIVRRDATLQLDDLTKYGIDSVDSLYALIYGGKGSMPGYGEGCTPRGACTFAKRLTDEQVKGLAGYVLQSAKDGWQ